MPPQTSSTPNSNDSIAALSSSGEMTIIDKNVDLYSVLEIAPESDAETVRQRINDLFAEAQKNIDHRNFRRRFYYQELFEVHLPQARFHLLDETRRRDYDISVKLKLPAASPNIEYSNYSSNDALPTVRETVASPTTPAAPTPTSKAKTPANRGARDLDLDALPSVADAEASPSRVNFAFRSPTPIVDAPAMTRFKAAQETAPEIAPDQADEALITATNEASQEVSGQQQTMRSDASLAANEELQRERRRDLKRRELIMFELMAVGTRWSIIGATGALVFSAMAWFFLHRAFSINDWRFNFVSVVIACVSMFVVGRASHREARRRTVALLSQMPYTQLLRRCAK